MVVTEEEALSPQAGRTIFLEGMAQESPSLDQ
jgi:hypothetical protein